MPGTQRERTDLGWRRTGLAAAGVTLVFVHAHIDHLDAAAVVAIALALAVVLAVLVVCARRPATTDGKVSAAVALLVALIAVAQLATIVLA